MIVEAPGECKSVSPPSKLGGQKRLGPQSVPQALPGWTLPPHQGTFVITAGRDKSPSVV
jgi:hypothetical protein